MNENKQPIELTNTDRRRGKAATRWGELVIESAWRPSDKPRVESEGWLRANGYLVDRRSER